MRTCDRDERRNMGRRHERILKGRFPLVIFAIGYQTWPRKEPLRECNTGLPQAQVRQGSQGKRWVEVRHRQWVNGIRENWETGTGGVQKEITARHSHPFVTTVVVRGNTKPVTAPTRPRDVSGVERQDTGRGSARRTGGVRVVEE